jgi:hypothetical protein
MALVAHRCWGVAGDVKPLSITPSFFPPARCLLASAILAFISDTSPRALVCCSCASTLLRFYALHYCAEICQAGETMGQVAHELGSITQRQSQVVPCDTGNTYNGGLGIRISSVFVILIGSFIGI